ncbi:hypothetical protein CGC58_09550 [Capnocytophaga stomatis]|uniref:Uncharacterized protein n=1 Tax=Capnocytophaga stomatis TaxID=1848904 RepID=A0A250FZQ1_9FLAO|nr:hypothetical protein [Capnocytophaga stomatis]ATA89945.1 hypothetical protein CGC58_09550 [Capnocytophaga stomatis]
MDKKISYIKERILEISDYKCISKEKFIENFGMTYGNFKGKQKLTSLNSDFLDKILSEIPEINAEWLLTGNGSMLKNEQNQPSAGPVNDKYVAMLEKNNASLEKINALQEEKIAKLEAEIQALKSAQSVAVNQFNQPSQAKSLVQPQR